MPDNLFRRIVAEHHWSYEAFLNQFELAAGAVADRDSDMRIRTLTVSEKTFRRWTTGSLQGTPKPDVCRVLEFMFERKIEALFGTAPPGTATAGTDPITGAERLITMAARRALRFTALSQGSDVSADAISALQEETLRIALAYPVAPLHEFLDDLVNLQDVGFQLLEGKYKADQARDLHLLAAMSSGMLAKAAHDLTDPQAALTHARAAYLCAEQAGHDGLKGWVRAVMSLAAYFAGRPDEAVRYAQAGISLPGATGGVTAWLPSLEARAHAARGDGEATRDAITRAHRARENMAASELDQFGDLFAFGLVKQNYYLAEAVVRLAPGSDEAATSADEAVAGYLALPDEETDWSSLAGARAHQALARAARGQFDGAREALDPVLDLEPAQRINGVRVSVQRVYENLPAAGGAPQIATGLRTEIEEFSRTRPAALPR